MNPLVSLTHVPLWAAACVCPREQLGFVRVPFPLTHLHHGSRLLSPTSWPFMRVEVVAAY